jgi:hypothetical protein
VVCFEAQSQCLVEGLRKAGNISDRIASLRACIFFSSFLRCGETECSWYVVHYLAGGTGPG